MLRVVSILLAFIASWFRSRLALQMELIALRHQVAVYKESISRPKLRPADRLLWVWLSRLWPGWQQALEFVQPRTVIAWQKKRFRDYWRRLSQNGKPGRPAISKEVRELIQDMWRTNPTWGSPRIVGELRKLGINVAKATVEKYRPQDRKPPSPTWKAFLNNHVLFKTQMVLSGSLRLGLRLARGYRFKPDRYILVLYRYRGLRFLHRSNGELSSAFCVHHAGSRAPAYRTFQCDRTSDCDMDGATDCGSVWARR